MVMNIFIGTYHIVRDIFSFPKKLFEKSKQNQIQKELLEEKAERQKNLLKETVNSISSSSKAADELLTDKEVDKKDLITFNYQVKNDSGKVIKSSFDAKSISEVEAFLINEGYEIIKIEPRKKYSLDMNISLFGTHFKSGELSFALTQLSTYIKAGIPLVDSVRILAKQTENASKRKVYEKIIYDLVAGESFSTALENQSDVFPRLLINMVKASEMTGDLPTTLDEMSDYYTSIEQTKKQMITALTYPSVILLVSIIVVIFCLIYVVPSFVKMYAETESSLPGITVFTMNLSNFVSNYYILIISIIAILLIILITAYKNIKSFRKTVQVILMKTPVIGKIIIYSEVSMFTRTFAQLLNHSVHITDSMAILSKISNNEVYKEIIMNTLDTLSKGGKISESFRGHWAFPVVAYEMLVTGESTGKLGDMMEKVADHYSDLHKNAITSVKSLIEPVTIIFLAVAVGFILLSIVVPMFDIYGAVGSMS
jgi:type IV pilus assembly protein PilC